MKFDSTITNCIGTYNSLSFLKLAIESIRKNEYYNSPLIVFADGCTDGTNEWLEENKNKYNITTIIEPRCENSSIGYGMNRCAKEVKTTHINFLHADMYCGIDFDKGLLDELLELSKVSTEHNYKVRAIVSSYRVQPNIFHDGNEPDRPGTIMVLPDYFGMQPESFLSDKFDKYVYDVRTYNYDHTDPKAEGCSFIISKEDWDYIGGNDLRFKPTGYDDMDLFLRMRIAGFKYCATCKSIVYHFAGRGGNSFFGKGIDSRNPINAPGEQQSAMEFINKWGSTPKYDYYGMIDVSTNQII